MNQLTIIIAVIIIGTFFFEAFILNKVLKGFKLNNVTYSKSLRIVFLVSLLSFIISIILSLSIFSFILSIIIAFYLFYFLLKKYFLVNIKKSIKIYIIYNLISIVTTLIIALLLRSLVFSPFLISGDSMSPTYSNGDYLFVNKFNHVFSRGDVVIFHDSNTGRNYIKRIIGLPNEKIEIHLDVVSVNGQRLNEPYIKGKTIGDSSFQLSADQYFMMGDNREHSTDSRTLGPILVTEIDGKIFKNFGTYLFLNK